MKTPSQIDVLPQGIIKKENLNLENRPLLVQSYRGQSPVMINLKKEENIVRIIEIICSCGNKINIVCEYENEKPPHS